MFKSIKKTISNIRQEWLTKRLYAAMEQADVKAVQRLIKKGVDVNKPLKGKFPPIFFAIHRRNTPIISVLIDGGADLSAREPYTDYTPFMSSVMFANGACLKKMQAKTDMYAKGSWGDTALHLAAFTGDMYSLSAIDLKDKKVLNAQNNVGDTPLMVALKSNNLDFALALKQYEPDVSIKNNEGKTVYDLAQVRLEHITRALPPKTAIFMKAKENQR